MAARRSAHRGRDGIRNDRRRACRGARSPADHDDCVLAFIAAARRLRRGRRAGCSGAVRRVGRRHRMVACPRRPTASRSSSWHPPRVPRRSLLYPAFGIEVLEGATTINVCLFAAYLPTGSYTPRLALSDGTVITLPTRPVDDVSDAFAACVPYALDAVRVELVDGSGLSQEFTTWPLRTSGRPPPARRHCRGRGRASILTVERAGGIEGRTGGARRQARRGVNRHPSAGKGALTRPGRESGLPGSP